MKRSKLDGLRIRNDIRRLQVEGKQPANICKQLDLTNDNYWYYCSQIYKENKEILKKERNEGFAHLVLLTKARLDQCIRQCFKIIDDDKTPVKDRLEAMQLASETSFNIIRLLRDGIAIVNSESQDDIPKDDFPADEFIKFAKSVSREQFERPMENKL